MASFRPLQCIILAVVLLRVTATCGPPSDGNWCKTEKTVETTMKVNETTLMEMLYMRCDKAAKNGWEIIPGSRTHEHGNICYCTIMKPTVTEVVRNVTQTISTYWCCDGWTGNSCEVAICLIPCQNGGSCVGPNKCKCITSRYGGLTSLYRGLFCETPAEVITRRFAASCTVIGHQHIRSFDDELATILGQGTYTLVQDCRGTSTPEYQVVINQMYSCQDDFPFNCQVAVKITVDQLTVLLAPDGSYVNGRKVEVPTTVDKLIISKESVWTMVKGLAELQIAYNGLSVYIEAPSTMRNKVCGLCGNYNDDPTDDFMSLGGQQIDNDADFGEARIDPTETRRTRRRVPYIPNNPCYALSADKIAEVNRQCGVLADSEVVFNHCHGAVNPNYYKELCMVDMCMCVTANTGDSSQCGAALCHAATQYSRVCSHHGVVLNWRTPTFCPAEACTNGMVYQECGVDCNQRCGGFGYDGECATQQCVDGCFCPTGTLFDGNTCVQSNQCNCYRSHSLMQEPLPYPNGATFRSGCEICTCADGGMWNCRVIEGCTGRKVSDDPNY